MFGLNTFAKAAAAAAVMGSCVKAEDFETALASFQTNNKKYEFENAYKVFGLEKGATVEEIKTVRDKAFRDPTAFGCHPDKAAKEDAEAADKFKCMDAAFKLLKENKEQYDTYLQETAEAPTHEEPTEAQRQQAQDMIAQYMMAMYQQAMYEQYQQAAAQVFLQQLARVTVARANAERHNLLQQRVRPNVRPVILLRQVRQATL